MSNSRNSGLYPTLACYFCNESLDERLLQEHIHLCGAVLEECPNKCGAYIPRRSIKSHEKQCVKIRQFERHSLPRNFRMEFDEKEANYREKVFALLTLLRATVKEAEVERKQMMEDATVVKRRLETIENATQSMRMNVLREFENSQQLFSSFDQRLNTLGHDLNQVEGRTRASFEAVAYRLDVVQGSVIDQRNKQTQMLTDCENEVKELKKFIAKESILIGDIWDEHKKRMNDLKLELEMRCKGARDLDARHQMLSEKLEGVVDELKKHSDNIEKQEKTIKTLKHQLKDAIKFLEELLIKDIDNGDLSSSVPKCYCHSHLSNGVTSGRLLWRIDKYKEKMTLAKENDMVLRSPVFFNKEYGYALQMKLYLNGRDRWKDRNIIGCLRVVEGPWDPLLDWPCILRATVTLRDQDNPVNNVRKIVKTKANIRDEDINGSDRDSVIDMFIPHTLLTRYDGFTKNNVLFLDIQVTELKGSLSTSSLIA